MPPNARRRGANIVAPPHQNREKELIGGIKNALDRGETIVKAKQSFINAGYQQAEVEAAAQKVPAATQQISKPISTKPTPTQPTPQEIQPQLTTTATATAQPKKVSKKLIIILITISTLILIGAAILGLFWNSWFG